MVTTLVNTLHNVQGHGRCWATNCATANAPSDASAKRLEVYLTMQRQYADQLKLSHALSARLDVMASQAMVLQEVLVAALGKLESSKKRKAGAGGANESSYNFVKPGNETANPPSLKPLAAVAASVSTSAILPSPARSVTVVPTPAVWPLFRCSSKVDGRRGSGAMASPFASKGPYLTVNASSAAVTTLAEPPASDPEIPAPPPSQRSSTNDVELPVSPPLEPSLPALPSALPSAEVISWAPTNFVPNTTTVNKPTIHPARTIIPDGITSAVAKDLGASHAVGISNSAKRPRTLSVSKVTTRGLSTTEKLLTAMPASPQASKDLLRPTQPGMLLESLQRHKHKVRHNDSDSGSGGNSGDGHGGGSGHRHSSGAQRHILQVNADGRRQPANASMSSPKTMAVATALHNPLVFGPSYFSNPHVVQMLQLQSQLRCDAPAVRQDSGGAYPYAPLLSATMSDPLRTSRGYEESNLAAMDNSSPVLAPNMLMDTFGQMPHLPAIRRPRDPQIIGSIPAMTAFSPGPFAGVTSGHSYGAAEPWLGMQLKASSPGLQDRATGQSSCSFQGRPMSALVAPPPPPPPQGFGRIQNVAMAVATANPGADAAATAIARTEASGKGWQFQNVGLRPVAEVLETLPLCYVFDQSDAVTEVEGLGLELM